MPVPLEIIQWLENLPRFGAGIGLHRMHYFRGALEAQGLNLPPCIHVVGSNGKGSVSHLMASMLTCAGHKTGLFTSPHLWQWHERFQVDGQLISDIDIEESLGWVHKTWARSTHPPAHLGRFEALSAAALYYFSRQGLDFLMVEAGIGGRFDSTRIFTGDTAVLTSVDLEHTQLLGNTVKAITFDKMDICKPGAALFLPDPLPLPRPVLESYAHLKGLHLYATQDSTQSGPAHYAPGHMHFDLHIHAHKLSLTTSLIGPHQRANIRLAASAAWHLLKKQSTLSNTQILDAIQCAVSQVKIPLRLELTSQNPLTYYDMAHTPNAALSAINALKEALGPQKIILLTTISKDKNAPEILSTLIPHCQEIIFTQAPKSHPPHHLQTLATPFPTDLENNPHHALKKAQTKAKTQNLPLLITGSLYLAHLLHPNTPSPTKN